MKSKRNGFIISWILSLTLSASLIATPAYAKRDDRKKADNICKKYKQNMATEEQICRSQAGRPEEVEECKITAEHKVGQLREYCNAYDAMIFARNFNITAGTIYTAAAATCFVSCAYAVLEPVCMAASIGGTVTDIAGTIAMKVKFKNKAKDSLDVEKHDIENQKRQERAQLGTGVTTSAMGVAGSVTSGFSNGATAAANTTSATTSAASSTTSATTSAASSTTSSTASASGSSATSSGSSSSQSANAMCWVTSALMTATATMKWVNIGMSAKTIRSTEDEIIKLQPNSTEPTSVDDGALADSSESGTGNGSPGGPHAFGGSDGPGTENPFADGDKLLQTMAAASASPELTDHINKNSESYKKLGDSLSKLGINPEDFHNSVMNDGPAATLSKLGLAQSTKDAIAEIDSEAKSAMLAAGDTAKYGGGGSRTPASSGGSGAMDLSGLMGAFGAGGAGAGAAAGAQIATVNFGSNADTDIWHSKHKGSIFDIVSHKLNKTGDRLEKLDYALPMNRALAR